MVIRFRLRIPDRFSTALSIAEWGILENLLAFLTVLQSLAAFHETRRNDWRPQRNKSTTFISYFVSDLVDLHPGQSGIRFRILENFWLRCMRRVGGGMLSQNAISFNSFSYLFIYFDVLQCTV